MEAPMCVFARDLQENEGQKIKQILRRSHDRVKIRRATVILLSAQGMQAKEIARRTYLHPEYIRELIRRFNNEGISMLNERPRSGRPIVFDKEIRAEIVEIAQCPPRALGRPYTHWSLEKLREYLVSKRVLKTISIETLRQILKEERVSLQRTKTWKESNDPDFESKKND
jgi:transposase